MNTPSLSPSLIKHYWSPLRSLGLTWYPLSWCPLSSENALTVGHERVELLAVCRLVPPVDVGVERNATLQNGRGHIIGVLARLRISEALLKSLPGLDQHVGILLVQRSPTAQSLCTWGIQAQHDTQRLTAVLHLRLGLGLGLKLLWRGGRT